MRIGHMSGGDGSEKFRFGQNANMLVTHVYNLEYVLHYSSLFANLNTVFLCNRIGEFVYV